MTRLGRRARLWVWCYAMLLPVLAIYAYVRIVPIGRSVELSLFDWKLIARVRPFVGFDNYARMLVDENFHIAIWNTTVYSLSTVLLSTIIALPLAVLHGPPRPCVSRVSDDLLPAGDHAAGADVDRLEVDLRL